MLKVRFLNLGTIDILVFYCYITNDRFGDLKQYPFTNSRFCKWEVQYSVDGSLLWLVLSSHLEARGLLPSSFLLWEEHSSSWLWDWNPHFLAGWQPELLFIPKGHSQILDCGPGDLSSREPPHICQILLTLRISLISSSLSGENSLLLKGPYD